MNYTKGYARSEDVLDSNLLNWYSYFMSDPVKVDRDAIYNSEAVMRTFGISRQQLTSLVKSGRLPDQKVAQKYVWTGEQVLISLVTPARMRPDEK